MRVFELHNHHLERGGSDVMFSETVSLLREGGHDVTVIERDNRAVTTLTDRVWAATSGIYSIGARKELLNRIARDRPHVVHVHNVYPLLSTSVFDACANAGVPAVARLADFTYLCPTSHRFRDGSECRRCEGGREYHCVAANCRGRWSMSLAYAVRTASTRLRGVLAKVAAFVAPSRYLQAQFVAAGFPASKVTMIPNFVPIAQRASGGGDYIAYAGRLAEEKGVGVVIEAARRARVPLRIAGEPTAAIGPTLRQAGDVKLVGRLDRRAVLSFLAGARAVAVPSLCAESFGLSAAEAMGQGVAVIASRIGALEEVVGDAGLLCAPGAVDELADSLRRVWHDPEVARRHATLGYERARQHYAAAAHLEALEGLFERLQTGAVA